jgi:purine-cytosine permease-like protein
LAVDLVIAMPVSWLPLVADFNRFARRGVSSASGTFWGYAFGNAWFYALGALLVAGSRLIEFPSPADLGLAIAGLAGGWVVLLALLAGETDEAFADIYSAAVSSQNLAERIPQRGAILAIAGAGTALAAWLGHRASVAVGTYESFLFLLGSVFVPLFGIFVADYFLLGRKGRLTEEMFSGTREGRHSPRLRATAVAAWGFGFLIYQWNWSVPPSLGWWTRGMRTLFHSWLHLPYPLAGSTWGASIPSFVAAMVLYAALAMAMSVKRPARR